MPDTARYLEANLTRHDQIIVLTGSMIPLHGVVPSDAAFNLGFSFAKVLDLKPGVYISMQGKIYEAREVAKDMHRGRFYSIFGEK